MQASPEKGDAAGLVWQGKPACSLADQFLTLLILLFLEFHLSFLSSLFSAPDCLPQAMNRTGVTGLGREMVSAAKQVACLH